MLRVSYLSVALLASLAAEVRAQGDVQRAPVPEWVVAVEPAWTDGAGTAAVVYGLIDFQDDARGAALERYVHVVKRVGSRQAVDAESQIAIDFDPSYQTVLVHQVAVRRGDETIDQLELERFEVIQREAGLERQVRDGIRTALLTLHDVRVGDVIELGYTTRGASPSFGGKYVGGLAVAGPDPVARFHARILWPEGRELATRVHGIELEPAVRAIEGGKEFVWDVREPPTVEFEDASPSWYTPVPWIQASEFRDWGEVADWASNLFALPETCGERVRSAAEPLRAAASEPRERARLALRFVQTEVRYLAVTLGEGAYRPRAPDEVLERRYGDCKDKANLLVAILRELGVEAETVLVNTALRGRLGDWLPSPGAFDHAIVRVHLPDGPVWADPTSAYERGPLSESSLGDWGLALSWRGPERGLVPFERAVDVPARVHVERTFRVEPTRKATLHLVTTYEGAEATAVRAYLDSVPLQQVEKSCLEFCARDYAAVRMTGPVEVEDDEARQRIVVTEHYAIPNLWTLHDEEGTWAPFCASDIDSRMVVPEITRRRSPLALPFPEHVVCETTAHLPASWPIEPQNVSVRNPAFSFAFHVSSEGKRLVLRHEYRTLAEHVEPEAVGRYLGDVTKAKDWIGYQIISGDVVARSFPTTPEAPEEIKRLGGLVFWAAVIALVVRSQRRRKKRALAAARTALAPAAGAQPWPAPSTSATPARPKARRAGSRLVVPRTSKLPPRCVECNARASRMEDRTFQWHPAWMYWLAPTLVLYLVTVEVAGEKVRLDVGICDRHVRLRGLRRVGVAALAVGGFVVWIFSSGTESAVFAALFFLGVAAVVSAAVLAWWSGRRVRATRIDDEEIELRGVCEAYLRELEPAPLRTAA